MCLGPGEYDYVVVLVFFVAPKHPFSFFTQDSASTNRLLAPVASAIAPDPPT